MGIKSHLIDHIASANTRGGQSKEWRNTGAIDPARLRPASAVEKMTTKNWSSHVINVLTDGTNRMVGCLVTYRIDCLPPRCTASAAH